LAIADCRVPIPGLTIGDWRFPIVECRLARINHQSSSICGHQSAIGNSNHKSAMINP
jgi:hypothetical protein